MTEGHKVYSNSFMQNVTIEDLTPMRSFSPIVWDKDALQKSGEDLKATIRATLPHLAKQEDETAYPVASPDHR